MSIQPGIDADGRGQPGAEQTQGLDHDRLDINGFALAALRRRKQRYLPDQIRQVLSDSVDVIKTPNGRMPMCEIQSRHLAMREDRSEIIAEFVADATGEFPQAFDIRHVLFPDLPNRFGIFNIPSARKVTSDRQQPNDPVVFHFWRDGKFD